MESAPSSCLVQSSSLSDFAYCPEIPNRILQERSSNVQQDVYNPHERGLLKYEHTPVPENVYGNESPACLSSHPLHQSQARLERQSFRWLYRQLWQNEQYRKYRESQSKDSRPSSEQKWPTNHEILFFRGVVKFPPMGRKKVVYKDDVTKPLGRNECIAAFMNDELGFTRYPDCLDPIKDIWEPGIYRKQVSSHIQVLKAYFKYDFDVLRWLESKSHGAHPYASNSNFRRHVGRGRRAHNTYRAPAIPFPLALLPSQSATKHRNTLELDEFHMYTRNACQSVHSFTRSHPGSSKDDIYLGRTQNWRSEYPQIAHIERDSGLNCDIVVAEASLLLTTPLHNVSELAISSTLSSDQKQNSFDWYSTTRFYEDNKFVKEFLNDEIIEFDDNSRWLLQLKFGSDYWSKVLAQMMHSLRAGAEVAAKALVLHGDNKNSRAISDNILRQTDAWVCNRIRSITAVQEIWAYELGALEKNTGEHPYRTMIIYWKFKQTEPGETAGITTWQNLIPSAEQLEPAEIEISPDHHLDTQLDLNNHNLMFSEPQDFVPDFSAQHDLDAISSDTALIGPAMYDYGFNMPSVNCRSDLQPMSSGYQATDFAAGPHFAIPCFDEAAAAEIVSGYDPVIMGDTSAGSNALSECPQLPFRQRHVQDQVYPTHPTQGYATPISMPEHYEQQHHWHQLRSQQVQSQQYPLYPMPFDDAQTYSGSQQPQHIGVQPHSQQEPNVLDSRHEPTQGLGTMYNDPGIFVVNGLGNGIFTPAPARDGRGTTLALGEEC